MRHLTNRRIVRATVVALVALSAVGALATAGVPGDSGGARVRPTAERGASNPVTVRLLTTSQRNMLRLGYMRVRVRGKRVARLRLVARGRRAGGRVRLMARRRVRLRRPGRRTVRLRLGSTGRRLLRSCARTRLSVRGSIRARNVSRRMRTRRSSRLVRRDPRRCGAGAPGSLGGGSETPPAPLGPLNTDNADRCDFLDPSVCLYPWPNDHFTTRDGSRDTGRRLNLSLQSMPANRVGKPIDPTDVNRSDGFSPGNMIVTKVPGLESTTAWERSGAVPIWDPELSFQPAQPIVVINATTKQRHLIWSEVDSNPSNPKDVTLLIRPAVNFKEGQRYIVALRNLKDRNGNVIRPREEFRAYRDGLRTSNPDIESRRAHYESIFATLGEAGIARKNLYLAWDFTVASERSLSERMLSVRDDAFGQDPLPGGLPPNIVGGLGDTNLADLTVPAGSAAPGIVPNTLKVTNFTEAEDPRIGRRVEGKLFVPCYLDLPGCLPGGRFLLNPATGLPQRNPVPHLATFTCHVPRNTLATGAPPARVSLYGHGLLGNRSEINQGQLKDFGQEHNIVFCATDWAGMSCADLDPPDPEDPQEAIDELLGDLAEQLQNGQVPTLPNLPNCDLPNVLGILQDVSQFPTLADRVQQGMLNFLYLGRLMIHPQGLSALPAFQKSGQSMLDTRRLFYDGNSQGGIIGGALAAVGVDHDRAVLGVPGMNYSTLLRRSVDFDSYAEGNFEGVETPVGLYDNYPNELERPLILSVMQLMWDRAEANGYVHHMTSDPLPNTPPHKVMLHVGFGDHQVADVSADVESRTVGARIYQPVLDVGRPRFQDRSSGEKLLAWYGLPAIPLAGGSYDGSALVYWDIGPLRPAGCLAAGPPDCEGTLPPPAGNVPPRVGVDPHEFPRRSAQARQQKSEFLKLGGSVKNFCGARPCYAAGWPGE